MQLGLCYTSRHRPAATDLAARLQQNLDVSALLVECDDEPVSAIWEQATSASTVLLILDAISAPAGPVRRDDWEALLEHNGAPPVAVWRAEACQYPKLLERRPFLATADPLEAARWVERWLVSQLPAHAGAWSLARADDEFPAHWWADLVDQPGCLTYSGSSALAAAQAFAFRADPHFQGVLWIPSAHRPWHTIVAEAEFRAQEATRLLIVLAGWEGEIPQPPAGRHSWLAVPGPAPLGACQPGGVPTSFAQRLGLDISAAVTLDDAGRWLRVGGGQGMAPDTAARDRHRAALVEQFRPWRVRMEDCDLLAAEVPAACDESAAGRELCFLYARFLAERLRTHEAAYWLRGLIATAQKQGDAAMAEEARRELSWLVDDTGAVLRAPVSEGEQLTLFGF